VKKRRPSPLESTAHHEAGHVVVAHLLGCYSDFATIEATEYYKGLALRGTGLRQTFRGAAAFNSGERPEDISLPKQLTHLYAGIVAQRLLCTKRGVSSKHVRLGHDIRRARDKVRSFPKKERIELLSAAEKCAMALLSDIQNWQKLERIAVELLKYGNLEGPVLELLLEENLFD
jgi:hypothetical protein